MQPDIHPDTLLRLDQKGINAGKIVDDLDDDNAWLSPDSDAYDVDQTGLSEIVEQHQSLGQLKVVVLDDPAILYSDARNLAQTLQDATESDTVIVQAPHAASTVSNSVPRFNLESESELLTDSFSTGSLEAFLEAAPAAGGSVNTFMIILFLLAILSIAVTICCANFLTSKN